MPDSLTLDDLRLPEDWFKKKLARPVTAAGRLKRQQLAASSRRDAFARRTYTSSGRPKRSERQGDSATLARSMRSTASHPPSVDLPGADSVDASEADALGGGDSLVLNARSGLHLPQEPSLLLGSTASERLAGALASRSASQPMPAQAARGSPANFATSSLAFTGEGGMQLTGLSGMFGVASMPDLTDHDPRGSGGAQASTEGDSWAGAITAANRSRTLRSIFKEDEYKEPDHAHGASLPLGVAPRDPFMGAGTAAGYGIGHEVRLAERGDAAYGAALARRKAAGETVYMYEEDAVALESKGWDPAEIGKARRSEQFLQTGAGLKAYAFKGRGTKKAPPGSTTLPCVDAHLESSQASIVAPSLRATGGSGAQRQAATSLRGAVQAQLAATPLAVDPRSQGFMPHESILRSAPNAQRRKKAASARARVFGSSAASPRQPLQRGRQTRKSGKAVNPQEPRAVKAYDAGGARGLGSGLGKGAVHVPYKLRGSTGADGSLFTAEAMGAMIAAFEDGREIQRLRAELEEARASMESSSRVLQTRARDWYAEHNSEVTRLASGSLLQPSKLRK